MTNQKGILKGAERKEINWKKVHLGEPFHEVLNEFRETVTSRADFDATSLLQFGLFMAKALLTILKESEQVLGEKGQKVVFDALIKTGYDIGNQIIKDAKMPQEVRDIELMSYLATIVNTQAWTSIEEPKIDNNQQCSFDIIWCPLQRIYKPFDCRIQRYLVQGIINAFKDSKLLKNTYQIEFKSSIPSGAETCSFIIKKKQEGEPDKWDQYSNDLAEKALKEYKT